MNKIEQLALLESGAWKNLSKRELYKLSIEEDIITELLDNVFTLPIVSTNFVIRHNLGNCLAGISQRLCEHQDELQFNKVLRL